MGVILLLLIVGSLIQLNEGSHKKIFVTSSFNWNRDPTILSYRRISIPVKEGRHKSFIILISKMGKEVKENVRSGLPFFGFQH